MKIIFFGTPPFAADILRFLIEQGIVVVAIVTRTDKPKGRSGTPQPSAVKAYAQQYVPHIPLYQPVKASADEFIPVLDQYKADLFIVVAYGEIIRQAVLDLPRLSCVNVHASLLPKYRGAAPIQRCIMNGEQETGVTIMKMVRKMDAGEMIHVAKCPIGENTTYGELEEQLCQLGAPALLEVIRRFEAGTIAYTEQDESQVTFADKIEAENCQIDWSRNAQTIHNLIRGVSPRPGAWCYVTIKGERKRLKILQSEYVPNITGPALQILQDGLEHPVVICGQGGGVKLLTVQLEGKRAVSAKELLRGVQLILETIEDLGA
ncbi:MAG: Methionyl-tRNA formyltransferase [Chlamydiales bacterium]|jgi:methionyl-tRNA formyltransferase|nr:Methionyl-tRNA formyltransferase [Chlamydiales bacterium]